MSDLINFPISHNDFLRINRTVKQLQHHLRARIENDEMMQFFNQMDPDMLFR
ncbi:hypothetical protein VXS05_14455 [Photobacterium toruni]|uniref:hypothetical protein n=1 Tax=Photobacterium toruni TaxID=1935446 RepID=UPI002E18AB78|nr:hypothetical protein [Photobacterium toruni]